MLIQTFFYFSSLCSRSVLLSGLTVVALSLSRSGYFRSDLLSLSASLLLSSLSICCCVSRLRLFCSSSRSRRSLFSLSLCSLSCVYPSHPPLSLSSHSSSTVLAGPRLPPSALASLPPASLPSPPLKVYDVLPPSLPSLVLPAHLPSAPSPPLPRPSSFAAPCLPLLPSSALLPPAPAALAPRHPLRSLPPLPPLSVWVWCGPGDGTFGRHCSVTSCVHSLTQHETESNSHSPLCAPPLLLSHSLSHMCVCKRSARARAGERFPQGSARGPSRAAPEGKHGFAERVTRNTASRHIQVSYLRRGHTRGFVFWTSLAVPGCFEFTADHKKLLFQSLADYNTALLLGSQPLTGHSSRQLFLCRGLIRLLATLSSR
ncbi:hypothetical protein C7M84_015102 [Penaeus vannamei]|uniref:Uncharacterized protein n=1 Tax=Penaeus vannamei TaxID=6689 RepID=A0A423SRN0_PENVA|nr:hypothetical protein C7M84_015102 [Penaeus vannamei]